MKVKRPDSSDWLYIALLCTGAFVALIYVPFGWAAIGKAIQSEVTAAWAQAIGSFIALAVAIWVPARMRMLEAAERQAAAERVAFLKSVTLGTQLRSLQMFAQILTEVNRHYVDDGTVLPMPGIRSFAMNIEFPNEADLPTLHPIREDVGPRIARACGCMRTVMLAIRSADLIPKPEDGSKMLASQQGLIDEAQQQLDIVFQAIEDFNESRIAPVKTTH